jgi:hypothetical protein
VASKKGTKLYVDKLTKGTIKNKNNNTKDTTQNNTLTLALVEDQEAFAGRTCCPFLD